MRAASDPTYVTFKLAFTANLLLQLLLALAPPKALFVHAKISMYTNDVNSLLVIAI